jgi:hypothetical protein
VGVPPAESTDRTSSAIDQAELLGTILGSVLALPVLAGLGYGAWRVLHLVAF